MLILFNMLVSMFNYKKKSEYFEIFLLEKVQNTFKKNWIENLELSESLNPFQFFKKK